MIIRALLIWVGLRAIAILNGVARSQDARHVMSRRWSASALLALVACLAVATCNGGSPNGPGPVCNYAIAPASHNLGPDGGTATVTVTASAGCAWTATSAVPWLSIATGAAGTGNGSVVYTATANTSTDNRTASLTIATRAHTVTQQGRPAGCTLSLTPEGVNLPKDAASGTFAVNVQGSCAWTAASNADWLLVTSSPSGSGSGTVSYAVSRNDAITPRSGAIAVGQERFIVNQQGDVGNCQFTATPVAFEPCMPATTLRVTVTTDAVCQWTATSAAGWIGVSQASGTGSAAVDLSLGDNYDAPREGIVQFRWDTPTMGQNVRVAQAGCVYAVTRDTFAFAAPGGSESFDVLQQSIPTVCGGATQDRCIWSAVSDVPWITITSTMPRAGDNPVAFVVAANSGPARTGRITVRDRVVVISQTGS